MGLELKPLPIAEEMLAASETGHFYCSYCYPNGELSYCGIDVSSCEDTPDESKIDCVVCIDIDLCQTCKEEFL